MSYLYSFVVYLYVNGCGSTHIFANFIIGIIGNEMGHLLKM